MKPTPPTSPTFGEMLEELMDLSAGLGVALLPVLLLSVPGIILFVVLPALLLLPLALIAAALAVPPYLLARLLGRRRRRTPTPPARLSALRSVRTSSPRPG
jgi:Flp pilus assembly protein TadB